jgi:hypothetical protein
MVWIGLHQAQPLIAWDGLTRRIWQVYPKARIHNGSDTGFGFTEFVGSRFLQAFDATLPEN